MLPSKKTELHLLAARDFGVVLDELIPLLEQVQSGVVSQSWAPMAQHRVQARQLIAEANRLCGPAAEALLEARIVFRYRPPPMTGQPAITLNVAQNWASIFEPIPMFSPEELRGYIRQAEGTLDGRHRAEASRERGVVGWIARFVLLPQHVREAAGVDKGSLSGRAAVGAGVVMQLMVATIAGLAVVWIAGRVGL